MREPHCMCGNQLVANDDEGLIRRVLDHAHEAHPRDGSRRRPGPRDGRGRGFRRTGPLPLVGRSLSRRPDHYSGAASTAPVVYLYPLASERGSAGPPPG